MILDFSLTYQKCKRLRQSLKIMSHVEQFRRMVLAFEHFFSLTECNSSLKLSEDDVVNMFKEAHSVEEFCSQLKTKNLSEMFTKKLADYFKRQGYIKFPDLNFFCKACDVLLSKFLTDSTLSDFIINISLNRYVNCCGERRFSVLVDELSRTRQLYLELSNFVDVSCRPLDIEARFIFESLCKQLNLQTRNPLLVDKSIQEMLQSDEKSIQILFMILCFSDSNELSDKVKTCIISKMGSPDSIRNINIWRCFIKLPVENAKLVVINFSDFLNSLFDIINISSECFHCYYDDKLVWIPKSSDYLSYTDIFKLLNLLYSFGDPVKDRVINYFNSRKTTNHCLFFEDIETEVLKSDSSGRL